MDPTNSLSNGVLSLLTNNDIAIVALSVCGLFEAALIAYLLRGIFGFQDVLKDLELAVQLLNERINHKGGNNNNDN